ncbi:MAG: BlaI/MecI/CopY family transcriptional regulator [Gemmatimonadota bacterium]
MDIVFTDRELDVMNVLWQNGSATVAEVRDALHDELAYTTVLTILRTLQDKGYVTHEEEGRAHRYVPAVERASAAESAVTRMLKKLFSGSPELMLTHLVSERKLTQKDLKRMRKLIDDQLKKGG